jgi:hypothetical protein
MPLVDAGLPRLEQRGEATGEARAYARKIRPEYARGELVRVAGGRNQPEAELIRNLLIEEGVPSLLRRSAGFDVPDFLAAGPRDVLVPRSAAEHARETLNGHDLAEEAPPSGESPASPGPAGSPAHIARLAGLVLAGGSLAAGIAWLALRLAG